MKICLTGGIACGKSLLSRYLNELGVATIDADDIVHELIPDSAERRRLAAEVFADPLKRKALEARLHPIVKARIEAFLGNDRMIEWSNGRMIEGELGGVANQVAFGSAKPLTGETRATGGANASRPSTPASPSRHPASPSCLPCPSRQENPSPPPPPLTPYSLLPTPCSPLPTPYTLRIAVIPLLFEAHWEKNFDIICCIASDRETQISRMMTTRGYTRAEAEARLAAQMPVAEKAAKSHYVIHNDGTPDELKEEVKKFLTWVSTLS